jgi:hypothetical protein
MRVPSGRGGTAALLVARLGVLLLAGRLLPSIPGASPPAMTSTSSTVRPTGSTVRPTGWIATASIVRWADVPDVIGLTLTQAKTALRELKLGSRVDRRTSRAPSAIVVAQRPPAGTRMLGTIVGLWTTSEVVVNGATRRLRLGSGRGTVRYPLVAPDPARHALTVAVAAPRSARLRIWLDPRPGLPGQPVIVLPSTNDPGLCQPVGQQVRCIVGLGALEGASPGMWTISVAKDSALAAVVEVTVTFAPR